MAIEETIDRLYGLPPAEFTQARNEAAGELRRAGQREAADRVKALRRPTAAAAAVNRLVREHRGEVERFLRAAAVLRDAQFSGKGDLAAAAKQEHEALEGLTSIGGEAVRQTLLAAAVDDDAAEQLLEARLERELEPRGFGTLLAHAPRRPPRDPQPRPRRRRSRLRPRGRRRTTAPPARDSKTRRLRSMRPRRRSDTHDAAGRRPSGSSRRRGRRSRRPSATSTDSRTAHEPADRAPRRTDARKGRRGHPPAGSTATSPSGTGSARSSSGTATRSRSAAATGDR